MSELDDAARMMSGESAPQQPAAPTAATGDPAEFQRALEMMSGAKPSGPPFQPAAQPTRTSEFMRSVPQFLGGPENNFWTGTGSDVYEQFKKQTKEGWERATDFRPTKTWGELGKREASRIAGGAELAGTYLGAPVTAAIPVVGHAGAAAIHGVGSLIDPKTASYEVPDTSEQPYKTGEPEGSMFTTFAFGNPFMDAYHMLLGQPTEAEQWAQQHKDKPRPLYSGLTHPAAELGSSLLRPQGATASPYHTEGLPSIPSTGAQIKEAGVASKDAARGLGITFKPERLNTVVDDIIGTNLKTSDMGTIKPVIRQLNELRSATDIDDVLNKMSILSDLAAKHTKPLVRGAAKAANHGIMDFIREVGPGDFHAPTAEAAEKLPGLIDNFRKNYAIGSTAERLGQIKENLEIGAEGLFGRHREVPEALVKQAAKMRQTPGKYLRYWSPEAQAQLKTVQQGTIPARIAQGFGKIAPELPGEGVSPWGWIKNAAYTSGSTLPWLMGAHEGAGGLEGLGMSAGTAATLGIPAMIARHWAQRQPLKQWEKLSRIIRSEAPAGREFARPDYPFMAKRVPVPAGALARQIADQWLATHPDQTSPSQP